MMSRVRSVLTTAPVLEPVTLAELKLHMRIDGTEEEALALGWIAAARRMVETCTNRALLTQTWTAYLDCFPAGVCDPIRLPRPRLQAISTVKYRDTAGVLQTLSSSLYQVDTVSEPARLAPAYGQSWPSTRPQMNAVEIAYTCGYGDLPESVPDELRHAILLICGHFGEHRETVSDFQLHDVPMSAQWLMDAHRVIWFE